MLLSQFENGAGVKGDIPPSEWLRNKPASYLDLHLIPHGPALWELDNFKAFIDARKQLLVGKFKGLLQTSSSGR